MIRHFAAHARDFSHARRKKSSGAMKNDGIPVGRGGFRTAPRQFTQDPSIYTEYDWIMEEEEVEHS